MLVFHTRKLLETYGTVGFWAEDSIESIHAIVNTLAHQNAALDRKRRAVQVLRGLEGRKQRKTAEMEAKAKKQDGSTLSRKQSRTQGRLQDSSKLVTVEPNQDIVDAADEFIKLVEEARTGESWDCENGDSGPVFPEVIMEDCPECMKMEEDDVAVPKCLLRLHNLLRHEDVGAKYEDGNKKQKTS